MSPPCVSFYIASVSVFRAGRHRYVILRTFSHEFLDSAHSPRRDIFFALIAFYVIVCDWWECQLQDYPSVFNIAGAAQSNVAKVIHSARYAAIKATRDYSRLIGS